MRTAVIAAAVALAYYVGSLIGLVLRVPPETTSVLWPPNAILTATLLLVPAPRRWWIYLAAAFPAHLVVQSGTGWPLPMILALYVTNCSEAVIAAACIRYLDRAPVRFDTLRGMVAFLVGAVLVGPFLSSFPDAWIVTSLRGEPFWSVWRNRFFANTLTELIFVPAIVILVGGGVAALRRVRPWRIAEAALFGLTTFAVAMLVFAGSTHGADSFGGVSNRPVGLLLAPFLWGAMRFGPAGTSFSLLTMAVTSLWAGIHGRGLLSGVPPREGAVTIQSVTWIVGVPLMCLAAILREREAGRAHLLDRLQFQRLLSEFSGALVHLPSHEMNAAFDSWLGRLGERLGMDRLLVLLRDDHDALKVDHSWASSRVEPTGDRPPGIPMALTRIAEGALSTPPAPSSWVNVAGVGFVLAIPLIGAGRTRGALMFVCREGPAPDRADELNQRLGLFADVLASALARKDTEDALRSSEETKSAILSSLPTSVAVLDGAGTIVAVNEVWRRWAQDDADGARKSTLEGRNYLEAWRRRSLDGAAHADEIAEAIQGVLDGSRASFTGEYQSAHADGRRWYALSIVPRVGPTQGAVVSLTDVTQRRSVEIEAQNSRHELAHLLRVSTVGAMATSLAHELTQPLTAILANAQAAQRTLRARPPDVPELQQILAEMIAQDKRAGEVIGRLRELLRKGETRREAVSLSTVVRDVAHLLASDAVIRNVNLRLQLDDGAPLVFADGTQIQQVVLNLLLNAMDACGSDGHQGRTVTVAVRAESAPSGPGVQVSVSDTGTGIPPACEQQIFEPFYTTKASGMGMGLSIARSIVLAHGGRIEGANNPGGGATFTFFLPERPK